MLHIVLDFDPEQANALEFASETADLVYFLSWAFSSRYGATHEMSVASLVLRREFKIDLVPLLTFADREVEEPADAEALQLAWQEAAPLAECCEAVVEALISGEKRLAAILDDYPNLRENIAELGRIARWAAEREARIRVTYVLDE
jgi:hypothetical protein